MVWQNPPPCFRDWTHDMVYNAGVAGGATRPPFTFYLVVAILFLVITGVSILDFGGLTRFSVV
ncbi:MAG: hypothetical protein CM1200mP30_08900 [Pseudomonadota bacterium]|nr:MAG: hypothetical protein CM1200mP30_08900 [Pseudomonadota bacterium]